MKTFFEMLGSLVISLSMLAVAVLLASWLVAPVPAKSEARAASVADLWTREPQKVDRASLTLERVPAAPQAAPDAAALARMPATEPRMVAQTEPAVEAQPALPAEHVSWCAERYRSYNPDDNSYRSYSGQQRPCVSPYLAANDNGDILRADTEVQSATEVGYVETASAETDSMMAATNLSAGHIESCLGRYRSYRPEDNTYQPYSGGPRRQCE
ncbi:BA14K family protein [Mesorhizobium sp. ES1-1]|uniref:BA14K family protein n=1 Tax=Mesorhizobium sp. ES1-1 TaxID=2876629 RepID=UPI001CCD10FE|nr:BA14K family protein [Mesorhizobium sp. ES1-1]MBZ9678683.1 BA14K family protein [Mesorhizobium sp. ES1-1]